MERHNSTNRFEDAMENYMEDTVPLVPVNHANLEIAASYKDHLGDEKETCLGDTWRLLAGLVLAILMASPFFFYKQQNEIGVCMDYSKLLETAVSKESSWCKDNSKHCTCQSPVEPLKYLPFQDGSYKQKWDSLLQQHAFEAATTRPNLVLLGDSITEHWMGTSLGVERPDLEGIANTFSEVFDNETTLAFGISGDQCPQLLYRLQNGEAPSTLDPKVWWILIGTNDLGRGCSRETVLVGILFITNLLLDTKTGVVVLNSILPRSNGRENDVWSNDNEYWNDIAWINHELECFANQQERVDFFNATDIFRNNTKELLPDGLHPSALGSRLWGQEINKRVQELVDGN